jgi:hypothetical protein
LDFNHATLATALQGVGLYHATLATALQGVGL